MKLTSPIIVPAMEGRGVSSLRIGVTTAFILSLIDKEQFSSKSRYSHQTSEKLTAG